LALTNFFMDRHTSKTFSNYKNSLLILSCLLSFCRAVSQQPANALAASFNQYAKNTVTEKIFTHTDKDFYLAGEILWFKLYVVNADDNKPMNVSKVAYVEIIDRNQKPVLQCKIALKDGTGDGSLYLPIALNSGVYEIRAYTSWMKNFAADFYFHKQITIVNSLKNFSSEPSPRNYDIQFFPEGGNLVKGIPIKVAFRMVDQSGHGTDGKGVVVDNNGGIVAEFQPLKFGIGSFSFKPVGANTYKAVIKIGDTTITRELPKAMDNGYVLQVDALSGSQLEVNVTTNISSAQNVYLLIHTRNSLKLLQKLPLTNGTAELVVDKNKFGEGVSHITVFNDESVPECERLFFLQPRQQLIIQPALNEQELSSRKNVRITVNSADEAKTPVAADMSVSIFRVDSLQSIPNQTIDNYFWLSSELKGNIESPGYYFSGKGAELEEALDNLMLTHGWRRFTWQNILNTQKPAYRFVPEYKGHIIYGVVTDGKTGLPKPDVMAYVSVPGARIQLYPARSDSLGNVRFYTHDLYGPNEIALQTQATGDTTYKLQVLSPFSDKFSSENFPSLQLEEKVKNLLSVYNVGTQVQNNFSGEKLKHFFAPFLDTASFFGKPDAQYLLDNYTRFSTMEEVLREYVYEVLVRRQKDNFRLIVTDADNRIFLDDPLTLFNGVPVFDPNKIIRYDPLNVKKIEVVKRRYFYGPSIFNGIVNFVTYSPDPSMLSDLSPMIMEYEGLQYQREFYSPVYETQEQISSRLPDFRNVLYWSPNVQTDTHGKTEINFFTSDLKGRYVAIIQGIDANGRVGEKSISFDVK
jgi:hypothetical protein